MNETSTVGRIEIGDVYIGSTLPPPDREVTPDRLLPAAKMVVELAALRARGARVIVLTLDGCGGGNVGESLAIYRALRSFSDGGGTTIAHVRGVVASTATALAVGCDVVVMDPGACLDVHSMAVGSEPDRSGNRSVLGIYEARTNTPHADLELWTSLHYSWSPPGRHYARLLPSAALELGWADLVGDASTVERIALACAQGSRPRTARSVMLAGNAAADGYKPNAPNALNSIVVGSGQIAGGSVGDGNTTRGANVDNLWPNPTSEVAPPQGADLSSPEWSCRHQDTSFAYAGSWVREVDGVNGGYAWCGPVVVACAPGDTFYLESQVRAYVFGTDSAYVQIDCVDGSGAVLAGGAASPGYTVGTAWAKRSVSATAPAGAVAAWLRLVVDSRTNGVWSYAYFDAIYARRVISNEIIAPPAPIAPSLNAGWSSTGSLGYWKNSAGEVRMRGGLVGPSGGLAFTLPVGYRPSASRVFVTASASFANFGTVTVNADGTVYPAGSYANPITCYMEAISFPSEG